MVAYWLHGVTQRVHNGYTTLSKSILKSWSFPNIGGTPSHHPPSQPSRHLDPPPSYRPWSCCGGNWVCRCWRGSVACWPCWPRRSRSPGSGDGSGGPKGAFTVEVGVKLMFFWPVNLIFDGLELCVYSTNHSLMLFLFLSEARTRSETM